MILHCSAEITRFSVDSSNPQAAKSTDFSAGKCHLPYFVVVLESLKAKRGCLLPKVIVKVARVDFGSLFLALLPFAQFEQSESFLHPFVQDWAQEVNFCKSTFRAIRKHTSFPANFP